MLVCFHDFQYLQEFESPPMDRRMNLAFFIHFLEVSLVAGVRPRDVPLSWPSLVGGLAANEFMCRPILLDED